MNHNTSDCANRLILPPILYRTLLTMALAGLLAFLSGTVQAQTNAPVTNAVASVQVSATATFPTNPVCGGTVTNCIIGNFLNPQDTNCEITITNYVWSLNVANTNGNGDGTYSSGGSLTNSSLTNSWSWATDGCGTNVFVAIENVTYQGYDCTNGYYSTSAAGTNTFTVIVTPVLNFNGGNLGNPITNYTVIVGQNINLTAYTSCGTASNFVWSVAGATESSFYVSSDSLWTNGYPVTLINTTNSSVSFFWVDAGSKSVSCSAVCGGITCSNNITFTVVRPTVSVHGKTGQVTIGSYPEINFGLPVATLVGISFSNAISMPTNSTSSYYNNGYTNYSTEWVQLITYNPSTMTISNDPSHVIVHSCQTVGTVLDTQYPYPKDTETTASDSPHLALYATNQIAASDSQNSKMWLMFQPTNGQWVPLWIVTWSCTATAAGFGGNATNWSFSGTPSISVTASVDSGATYPVWTNNASVFQWNPPF